MRCALGEFQRAQEVTDLEEVLHEALIPSHRCRHTRETDIQDRWSLRLPRFPGAAWPPVREGIWRLIWGACGPTSEAHEERIEEGLTLAELLAPGERLPEEVLARLHAWRGKGWRPGVRVRVPSAVT